MKEIILGALGTILLIIIVVFAINLGWFMKWDIAAQAGHHPVTLNRSVFHAFAIDMHNKVHPDFKVIIIKDMTDEKWEKIKSQFSGHFEKCCEQ